MSIINIYESLSGKTLFRGQIKKMIRQAKTEGHQEIEFKFREILRSYPTEKSFTFGKVSPLQQNASTDSLNGIPFLSEQERKEIMEESGLGKAVSPNEIYQYITDQIIKVLKSKKTLPWRKPWRTDGVTGKGALNFVSKKSYRGINSIMLDFIYPEVFGKQFKLPYFLTFNQVVKLKGKIKKGSNGYRVFYFAYVYRLKEKNVSEEKYKEHLKNCKEKGEMNCGTTRFPVVKYYNVFCADDIEGIDFKKIESQIEREFTPIEAADGVIANMPNPPKMEHKGDQAFYQATADRVVMPQKETFNSEASYYTTFFHELSHSTKHALRLNDQTRGGKKFGDKGYALEELIAELSAVFLCAESGILFDTIHNSQAYLKNWSSSLIKNFENDNKLFFRASSKAQASADFILDRDEKGVSAFVNKIQKKIAAPEKKTIAPEKKETAKPKKIEKKPVKAKTVPKRPVKKAKKETSSNQLEMVLNGPGNLPKYETLVGGSSHSGQYGILGQTQNGKNVALDLGETNTFGLFGVQGAGKSYSIGTVLEMALKQFPRVNKLPSALAGVIFHYSESMDYAPEFTSLKYPNDKAGELQKLKQKYGADPDNIESVILLTPRDKVEERQRDFPSINVMPIAFNSSELGAQDWMFLLGAMGNDSDYIRKLKSIMKSHRRNITIDGIYESVEHSNLLSKTQKDLAKQKLDFAREYIDDNYNLRNILKPGRLVIVDLRDEFIFKDEALGLFVIMLNIFSTSRAADGVDFNKFIVFDEAHKYMDNPELSGHIVTAIREMRHKGISIMIASQDPPGLPKEIIELSSVVLLHKFNSPLWLKHVQRSINQFSSLSVEELSSLNPGEGYLWASKSLGGDASTTPIKILTRPRVTRHGGGTLKADR